LYILFPLIKLVLPFSRENLDMRVRLVVHYNGLSVGAVRDVFEKSLGLRLQKMNPNTDYHCLKTFGSHFTEDIAIPAVRSTP